MCRRWILWGTCLRCFVSSEGGFDLCLLGTVLQLAEFNFAKIQQAVQQAVQFISIHNSISTIVYGARSIVVRKD